jgi:hypothetical protein
MQKNPYYANLLKDVKQTREAYIVITAVADGLSLLIYLILLFKLDKLKIMKMFSFGFIVRNH